MITDMENFINSLNKEVKNLYLKGDFHASFKRSKQIINLINDNIYQPKYIGILRNLAANYKSLGKHNKALSIFKKLEVLYKKKYKTNSLQYAQYINDIAVIYEDKGEFDTVEKMLLKSISIKKKLENVNYKSIAKSLNNLGELYRRIGKIDKSKNTFLETCELYYEKIGINTYSFAEPLNNLAMLCQSLGNFEDSKEYFHQALFTLKQTVGTKHPTYAISLNNLGMIYQILGSYKIAYSFYKEAIEIRLQILGNDHPDILFSLNSLALFHKSIADYESAHETFKKAIILGKKYFNKNHYILAQIYKNYGEFLYEVGNGKKALKLYLLSIKIIKNKIGVYSIEYSQLLNDIALILYDQNRNEAAKTILLKAIKILQNVIGHDSIHFVQIWKNLSFVDFTLSNKNDSLVYLKKCLKTKNKIIGKYNIDYVKDLNNLALMQFLNNELNNALKSIKEAEIINDFIIPQIFLITDENQKLKYLSILKETFDLSLVIILHFKNLHISKKYWIYNLVLRRKGLIFDFLSEQKNLFNQTGNSQIRDYYQKLNTLNNEIINLQFNTSSTNTIDHRKKILTSLIKEQKHIEKEIASFLSIQDFEFILSDSKLNNLFKLLPQNSILLDFIKIEGYECKINSSLHNKNLNSSKYIVFIISNSMKPKIKLINLGESKSIDNLITTYKKEIAYPIEMKLQNKINNRTRELGIKLRNRIFDHLTFNMNDINRIYISPDSGISLIPFEILPNDKGDFLISDYIFSYITNANEIIRSDKDKNPGKKRSLILADPDFDFGSEKINYKIQDDNNSIMNNVQNYLKQFEFPRLKDSRIEGKKIASLLNTKAILGTKVSKSLVSKCKSPQIFHIATHGFFIPESSPKKKSKIGDKRIHLDDLNYHMINHNYDNPLLKSGLLLSGANSWIENNIFQNETGNGILTAAEISNLQFNGTELGVLSACETGLGQLESGEGVYGLRRAFTISGIHTLIFSLWKISDKQTCLLMYLFYKNILKGNSIVDSLRKAQITVKSKYSHPFYWGAFICEGNSDKSIYIKKGLKNE